MSGEKGVEHRNRLNTHFLILERGSAICLYFVIAHGFELNPAKTYVGLSLPRVLPDLGPWPWIIKPVRAPDIGSSVSNHGQVTQP